MAVTATSLATPGAGAQARTAPANSPVADSPIRRFADSPKLYITNQGGASITIIDQQRLTVDTVIDLVRLPDAERRREQEGYVGLGW